MRHVKAPTYHPIEALMEHVETGISPSTRIGRYYTWTQGKRELSG